MADKPKIFDRAVEYRTRVRYSETDAMGIVYHGNYIVWFEIGRTEFCRAVGLPYRQMEERGILILVTAVECRFRGAARYDDAITVRTRMGEVGSRGLSFFYEIFRADDGALLAEGSTRHLFADSSRSPTLIPPDIRKTFADFLGDGLA
jgi:acyl-CoA thioester hydrolase